MATTYLSPGVYIEEIDRGPKPIQGVGTNVTAFIGFTERAEEPDSDRPDLEKPFMRRSCLGKAVMITNWTQYQNHFGGLHQDAYLPSAVRGFFDEVGVRCYIVSIHAMKALPGQKVLYAQDQTKLDNSVKRGQPTLFIQTKDTVASGAKVEISISLPSQAAPAAAQPPVQPAPAAPVTPLDPGAGPKNDDPAAKKPDKPAAPPPNPPVAAVAATHHRGKRNQTSWSPSRLMAQKIRKMWASFSKICHSGDRPVTGRSNLKTSKFGS